MLFQNLVVLSQLLDLSLLLHGLNIELYLRPFELRIHSFELVIFLFESIYLLCILGVRLEDRIYLRKQIVLTLLERLLFVFKLSEYALNIFIFYFEVLRIPISNLQFLRLLVVHDLEFLILLLDICIDLL